MTTVFSFTACLPLYTVAMHMSQAKSNCELARLVRCLGHACSVQSDKRGGQQTHELRCSGSSRLCTRRDEEQRLCHRVCFALLTASVVNVASTPHHAHAVSDTAELSVHLLEGNEQERSKRTLQQSRPPRDATTSAWASCVAAMRVCREGEPGDRSRTSPSCPR